MSGARVGAGPGGRARLGLTLLEVLVALAVLAVALLGWVRLEGALLGSERQSAVRREAASWLRDELRFQRNVRAAGCLADPPGPGWSCRVERTCLAFAPPCEAEMIRVTVAPPSGHALTGRTAVWWPLQRAPVIGEAP